MSKAQVGDLGLVCCPGRVWLSLQVPPRLSDTRAAIVRRLGSSLTNSPCHGRANEKVGEAEEEWEQSGRQ